ncbi:polyprenyl synthetase family protein [Patescibacteria group bacterium]|jgi:geranylgeranyl diphosphate synthase type I|nr:polyprenyl synthetase family protein [Patescibacteria group bacterium]
MDIAAFKRDFDRALARVLDRKMEELEQLTRDPYILNLAKHGCTLALQGGKRIRPYIAYITYRAAGGKGNVMGVLVGLELFHTFALVHDDIMDRGMERHGVATANRLFGDAQAILIGDLLFNWASEIIAPTKGQPIFAKMVDEVILGQMLDVDAIRRARVSDQFIQDKMRLKTASYSFIRPMQFGAALAGKSAMYRFCEAFGCPLGLAFQIQDDLLDLTASSKKLGKSAFNDVKEGQKTVFTQYASRKPANRTLLNKMKGRKLTQEDRRRIKQMFEESGAIEYGTKLMKKYFREADDAVKGLSDVKAKPFAELVAYIKSRAN